MRVSFASSSSLILVSIIHNTATAQAQAQYLDSWNYHKTEERDDGFMNYGPADWGDISCDEQNALDECYAYRDKWHTGRAWELEQNYCRWCPESSGNQNCGRHHQSPTINLERDRALHNEIRSKGCPSVRRCVYNTKPICCKEGLFF
jgi:hypothetical protein